MNIVRRTIPKHTEENIPLDQEVQLLFMVDLNKNSISSDHVILFNITQQKTEEIRFEYYSKTLKVKSVLPLEPLNHYQLKLVGGANGIKSITGHTMAETYELEFYTKDVASIKPPRIFAPTNVSIVREYVTFEFEKIQEADYYELQISQSNTFHNVIWPLNDEKIFPMSELKVTPYIEYKTGQYYARVRSVDKEGIKSAWSPTLSFYYDGNPVIEEAVDPIPSEKVSTSKESEDAQTVILKASSSQSKDLTQLSQLQAALSETDETEGIRLYVKSTTPKNGSVNNSKDKLKTIVIEFTESIDPDSVNSSTCYLLEERN
ncbi:Ig-like domain-containing protein [Bacillus atrophaeus]|uniref:Ig-like domain-containing protein n=1 Tax=Bacillus atrophaeus TaxID=1452 RepID=UPI00227F3BA1|nr:Ig-like domain-containing protein [Bacillus atrophaeus]MCY8466549.1 Ig-like domain-containing protein [Bacillus atrophaeus]MCY8479008.1 Ig-like domain-containing protein [Bacillus atrophaeus]